MIDLYNSVTVKEAFWAVSGIMYAILECLEGILPVGTTLTSESNDRWRIAKATLIGGSLKDTALAAKGKEGSWFLYKLEPLEHNLLPVPTQKLMLIQRGS